MSEISDLLIEGAIHSALKQIMEHSMEHSMDRRTVTFLNTFRVDNGFGIDIKQMTPKQITEFRSRYKDACCRLIDEGTKLLREDEWWLNV
jgi:hypothetical protein